MKNDNKAISKVLDDIKKKQKNIASEVAPEINKLFRESVSYSLNNWYNRYNPKMYNRTNNFLTVYQTARTSGQGNLLTMTVDSSLMDDYLGFDIPPYPTYERQKLYAETAFDFMFMGGEHGHGKWLQKVSLPPFLYVGKDIQNGFNGKAQKIIDKKIKELLKI